MSRKSGNILRAWNNYALVTSFKDKPEAVQVATPVTVIGEEVREVFSTFTEKIGPVLAQFRRYCQPRKNIPFERYKFNSRAQEPVET